MEQEPEVISFGTAIILLYFTIFGILYIVGWFGQSIHPIIAFLLGMLLFFGGATYYYYKQYEVE
jgi:hypothetical protein